YRARRAYGRRQVRSLQILPDAFHGEEEKRLVLLERAANRSAELLAVKVGERLVVRCVRRQAFETLVVKHRASDLVSARLGNDVDDAAGRVAERRACPRGDDLELLDGFEGDVDRCALAAHLLAEETVRVVAAVEADVVEHAALARERDLVAVRTLDDAHAGG